MEAEIKNEITEYPTESEFDPSNRRAIAIVSGKGGSGKTMVVALIAKILSRYKQPSLIVDADLGTGGMTYYLGIKYVTNIAVGFSDLLVRNREQFALESKTFEKYIQPVKEFPNTKFLGIGHYPTLQKERKKRSPSISSKIKSVVKDLKRIYKTWIIVDCRGGSDPEIIAVCEQVDDILIVVESDTTSFKSTGNLVDTLTENNLGHKLKGFIINKVFSNPSVIARSGTRDFKCQYLSSVPFDLDAARDFLDGSIPPTRSSFGLHVWEALSKSYPDTVKPPEGNTLEFKDFELIRLSDRSATAGGNVIALILSIFFVIYFFGLVLSNPIDFTREFPILILLGILGTFEFFRKQVWEFLHYLIDLIQKLLRQRKID